MMEIDKMKWWYSKRVESNDLILVDAFFRKWISLSRLSLCSICRFLLPFFPTEVSILLPWSSTSDIDIWYRTSQWTSQCEGPFRSFVIEGRPYFWTEYTVSKLGPSRDSLWLTTWYLIDSQRKAKKKIKVQNHKLEHRKGRPTHEKLSSGKRSEDGNGVRIKDKRRWTYTRLFQKRSFWSLKRISAGSGKFSNESDLFRDSQQREWVRVWTDWERFKKWMCSYRLTTLTIYDFRVNDSSTIGSSTCTSSSEASWVNVRLFDSVGVLSFSIDMSERLTRMMQSVVHL